jgi:hypothetical protein
VKFFLEEKSVSFDLLLASINLFAKAFLPTPGRTGGLMLKATKNKMGAEKSAPILQNEGKRREKMKK